MVSPISQEFLSRITKNAREEALILVYWELIDQGKRHHKEAGHILSSSNGEGMGEEELTITRNNHRYRIHLGQGFLDAARDVAEILGIPENKILRK